MDSSQNHTLSPEEAKERLRVAAGKIGVEGWIRRHPYDAIVLGIVCGLVLGSKGNDLLPVLLRRLL